MDYRKVKQRGQSALDVLVSLGPVVAIFIVLVAIAVRYVNPAPPNHLVMSTGDIEGDYHSIAKHYQEDLKEDGIDLEIRPSRGSSENLKRLMDDDSDVEVAFVQDGLGTTKDAEDLVSLGSLYYEPIWVFYRNKDEVSRFSQFKGKRIAIGRTGDGIHELAKSLLQDTGVDDQDAQLLDLGWGEAAAALRAGSIDVAFFIATAEDTFIDGLVNDPQLKLMSVDQAEAISRQFPYLHHLILPHGVINLKDNRPANDVHMLATTATLLVRDSVHPALNYLLLKAATKIHSQAGILEHKGEFPIGKDFVFPISDEAKQYYKTGTPFWQKYMPFWLATLVDRFIVVVIPMFVVILPLIRMIPKVYDWRIRLKIFKCYGELKFLETQLRSQTDADELARQLRELDRVEEKINKTKFPNKYAEHIYSLRGHIQFVRDRLKEQRTLQG